MQRLLGDRLGLSIIDVRRTSGVDDSAGMRALEIGLMPSCDGLELVPL